MFSAAPAAAPTAPFRFDLPRNVNPPSGLSTAAPAVAASAGTSATPFVFSAAPAPAPVPAASAAASATPFVFSAAPALAPVAASPFRFDAPSSFEDSLRRASAPTAATSATVAPAARLDLGVDSAGVLVSTRVLISGVQSAQHQALNFQEGIALEYIAEAGRYVVRLDDGEKVRLRPANLTRAPPRIAPSRSEVLDTTDAARLVQILNQHGADLDLAKAACAALNKLPKTSSRNLHAPLKQLDLAGALVCCLRIHVSSELYQSVGMVFSGGLVAPADACKAGAPQLLVSETMAALRRLDATANDPDSRIVMNAGRFVMSGLCSVGFDDEHENFEPGLCLLREAGCAEVVVRILRAVLRVIAEGVGEHLRQAVVRDGHAKMQMLMRAGMMQALKLLIGLACSKSGAATVRRAGGVAIMNDLYDALGKDEIVEDWWDQFVACMVQHEDKSTANGIAAAMTSACKSDEGGQRERPWMKRFMRKLVEDNYDECKRIVGDADGGSSAVERGMRAHGYPTTADSNAAPLPWPLARAAEAGDEVAVRSFLDNGGAVDARTVAVSGSLTMLMLAARQGQPAIVELLLALGANANLRHLIGGTALMGAAEGGHLSIVKTLLQSGAHADLTDQDGWSALDFAKDKGHRAIAKVLQKQRKRG